MPRRSRRNVVILGVILILAVLFMYIGNNFIGISRYTVKSDKIPPSFNGFTIVQISDLHNAEFGKHNESLLRFVSDAKPDIIVITGDLIDCLKTDVDVASSFVKNAVAISPVYYINGNHEAAVPEEYKKLRDNLEAAGVTVLENETTDISVGNDTIKLTGINDPSFYTDNGSDYIRQLTFPSEEDNCYRILLAHRPEHLQLYTDKADLVFSGHAHGGQFIIPFFGGLVAPDQGFFPKYYSGIYQSGSTQMVVSRGLGNSIIPIRINNRPEITVITLSNQKA